MIKRFKQGDLDGLCGVYAVVNAVIHRIVQTRVFADEESDQIFEAAIRSLPKRLFPDAIIDGLDVIEMTKLSRSVARYMETAYGRVLRVSLPFRDLDMTSVTEVLDKVSWLHSNKPTAFIFGFSFYERGIGTGGHWVAFKEFQPHGIQVINNGATNKFRSTKMRVNGTGKRRLDYRETIMFETVSVDGQPPQFDVGK